MDGLIIAERLGALPPLPVAGLTWHFPSTHEYMMEFVDGTIIVINVSKQNPGLHFAHEGVRSALRSTPFQHQLRSRASGSLITVEQLGLDRVVSFRFSGGGDGFVRSEPAVLIAELTGTRANLILTDSENNILGVHQVVSRDMNRFRQLRPGVQYTPPPQQDRLDPRTMNESEFAALVEQNGLEKTVAQFAGMGPSMQRVVLHVANDMPAWDALSAVVQKPSENLAMHATRSESAPTNNQLERHRKALRTHLERTVLQRKRRLRDAEKNLTATETAERHRMQGDILLSYQGDTKGVTVIETVDFAGEEIRIQVDPELTTHDNAALYYQRARKSVQRADHAQRELPALREAYEQAEQTLTQFSELSDEEIVQRAQRLYKAQEKERAKRELPGLRTKSPSGYTVIIGRSSKENDAVTFTQSKSLDLWFHAQGYRGSHVIMQSRGKDVPLEDILFASALAAGYSGARDSGNVPVDYTERKHVWRQKGGGPGAVNFTQYKTVWVDPRRVGEE